MVPTTAPKGGGVEALKHFNPRGVFVQKFSKPHKTVIIFTTNHGVRMEMSNVPLRTKTRTYEPTMLTRKMHSQQLESQWLMG